jgi:polysaccharide deacetylase 2 family uncharacterized protein YibQ
MKKFYNKKFLVIFIIITGIIVLGTSFIAGYIVAKNSIEKKIIKDDTKSKEALKSLQKLVDENIIKEKRVSKENNKSCNKTCDKNSKKMIMGSEVLDYIENSKKEKNISKIIIKPVTKIIKNSKPKLVIIMDDMSFKYQVNLLKNLHMKITPSFFPPTYNHPHTAEYAKEFKHYMVHFPMQATNSYFHEEPETLHVDSNYSFIESRVKFIKKNFPNVKFVNNHTGSKFTSNLESMKKLYKALSKYNLIFVDSVTTANSKAPIVAKEYHKILLQRDVFLDNFPTMTYIKNQLKFAVKKAEKNGYAIAICHPHKLTFKALKESKNILKNVELIYIGDMYNFAKEHNISRL